MQFEIANDVAGRFAHEFYGALADGYPIDASLTEAPEIHLRGRPRGRMGTPVLYLRAPDGRIFDIDSSAPPARAPCPTARRLSRARAASIRTGSRTRSSPPPARRSPAGSASRRSRCCAATARRGGIGDALRELTLEHERLSNGGAARNQGKTRRAPEGGRRAAGERQGCRRPGPMRATRCSSTPPTRRRSRSKHGSARRSTIRPHAISPVSSKKRAARRRHGPARSNAPTPSRARAWRSSTPSTAGDLDRAEEELRRADESSDPGAEFADLRARLLELRREAAERYERWQNARRPQNA